MHAPWYSYMGIPYKGNCKAFYDSNDFDWGKHLHENKEKIKTLALEFLTQKEILKEEYFNRELVESKLKWELTSFLYWNQPIKQNVELGKDFYNIFNSIPGLTGLSISILPPNTIIKPHYGDTDAVCRIHIPVQIPAQLPECGLSVNNENKSWDDIIIFCDTHLHSAWNKTDKYRVVVIADILLPQFVSEKSKVCNNAISLLRLQKLLGNFPALNKLPWFLKGAIRYWFKFFISIAI